MLYAQVRRRSVFCSLLQEHADRDGFGYCAVELVEQTSSEQFYLPNTAVLVTRLSDALGVVVEVTDFAPRFHQFGRIFNPVMLIRQIRRVRGTPRIRLMVRPASDFGRERSPITYGSHHVRYLAPNWVLRLTTDASITMLLVFSG